MEACPVEAVASSVVSEIDYVVAVSVVSEIDYVVASSMASSMASSVEVEACPVETMASFSFFYFFYFLSLHS